MEKLNDRQKAFVAHYLDTLNATEAARRAGYSEKTARAIGAENLTKPDIAAAIQASMAGRVMTADEAAMRLSEHARGTMGDFIKIGDDGQPAGFNLGKDVPQHLIKKVSVTDKGVTFELYDAQAALVNVLKLHGKFVDRLAIEQEYQETLERLRANLSDEEYAKVAAILVGDTAS